MSWWWMSFADPKRPKGAQFLGVVVVQAAGPREAMQIAWRLKINPGGEVMFTDLSSKPVRLVPPEYRNRLLSKPELIDSGLIDPDVLQ